MYRSEMEASGQLYIPSNLPHTGKKKKKEKKISAPSKN
jgi:hypothetical protein